jgi:hypothetical protein
MIWATGACQSVNSSGRSWRCASTEKIRLHAKTVVADALSVTLFLCYTETPDDLSAADPKTIREQHQGAKIEELSKTYAI